MTPIKILIALAAFIFSAIVTYFTLLAANIDRASTPDYGAIVVILMVLVDCIMLSTVLYIKTKSILTSLKALAPMLLLGVPLAFLTMFIYPLLIAEIITTRKPNEID